MRRYLSFLLYLPLAAVLIIASYLYARTGITHVEAQQAVHVKPYIADYWLTSYTQNPKGEVIEKRHFVRFSGATAVTANTFFGEGPEVKPHREILLPDGRRLYVHDSAGARTTCHPSNEELARWKNKLAATAKSQTSCDKDAEVSLGTASVAGYRIWQMNNKAVDGTTNQMTWYRAPELGCLELEQKFANVSTDDKAATKLIIQVQSISPTEPAASELHIGQSYPEVAPSAFEKKTKKVAVLLDQMANSDACISHRCAPVEDAKAEWTRQDSDYKTRLSAAGSR
jgi:hypothetical protein